MTTLLRERLWFALASFIILCAGLAAMHWRVFDAADRALMDAGFRWLRQYAPQPVSRDVVLVGIDEATYRALPEPFALWHPHLGRFLKGMAEAGPSAIGVDVVLPDRSYDFLIPGYDRPLLEGLAALRGKVPVVLAQAFDEHGNQRQLFAPYQSLAGSEALGSVAVCRDADLMVRRFDPASCGDSTATSSLAGRMAAKLGIEQDWRGYIDYASGDPIQYVPFHQVLRWIDAQDTARLSSVFAGKPVLVGVVLPFSDRHPLPVALAAFEPESRVLPGALIHVQALRSMMHRGFVQPLAPVAVMLTSLLALALWFGRTQAAKTIFAVILVFALPAVALLMLWKGWWLPGGSLALLAFFAFGARAAFDARGQIRERRFLKEAFGSYVSPQILKEILGGRLRPGVRAHRQRIAIFHCNIRGFTARAEATPPEAVMSLLNDYFGVATEAIYRHGGTTNKFLGDGLLAFFGAPQPLENAERCALEAAQDLLEGLQDVNERLRQQGQPPLVVGVGIHTGEVVLGHVGGATHQEYTAIGAVVNMATRLEDLTRTLPYPVICSAPVAATSPARSST